jgi:hypothetical protein
MKERSVILAPYNSLHCLDDTMELSDSIEIESRAIKFGKNVREINRQYEQNNNADLDNGVVNE